MLPSLHIKNYRILRDLELKDLGRVNLIAGKNNSGKSSVLEAVLLLITGFKQEWVDLLIDNRGGSIYKSKEPSMSSFEALSTLFNLNKDNISPKEFLRLESFFITIDSQGSSLKVRFVFYVTEEEEKVDKDGNHIKISKVRLANEDDPEPISGIEITRNGRSNYYPLNSKRYHFNIHPSIQYIDSTSFSKEDNNAQLWDRIALTYRESYLIDALRIVEPNIEQLTFLGDNDEQRVPVAKVSTFASPVPLKSMGDGINRILNIILSLVNAENGYLLIDEFENGLHYTVQEDLWKMVFKLANELNVQVFATTHSYDCIRAFSKVAIESPEEGKLIRLDNINHKIKPTYYSEEELLIATQNHIEVR